MKECHVCLYLCSDEDEICPVCGAELRAEPEDLREEADKMAPELGAIANPVLAVSVESPVTAEIFKDILAENGIAFSTDGEEDTFHVGFGSSYFAIDIYVDEADLQTAKELYRNLTENEMTFEDFEDFTEDGEQ